MKHGLREKNLLKQGVTGASSSSETLGQKGSQVCPRSTPLLWFHLIPALPSEVPDQRTDAPGKDYNDAEEVPVLGVPLASQGREEEELPEKEDGMRSQTGEWGDQLIP